MKRFVMGVFEVKAFKLLITRKIWKNGVLRGILIGNCVNKYYLEKGV